MTTNIYRSEGREQEDDDEKEGQDDGSKDLNRAAQDTLRALIMYPHCGQAFHLMGSVLELIIQRKNREGGGGGIPTFSLLVTGSLDAIKLSVDSPHHPYTSESHHSLSMLAQDRKMSFLALFHSLRSLETVKGSDEAFRGQQNAQNCFFQLEREGLLDDDD